MILKLVRVSMHPWLWFTVVRPAVIRNTDSQSLERRQAAAAILDAIDVMFDPSDPRISSPYSRMTAFDEAQRDARNAELEAKFPDTYRGHPEYSPPANPLRRKDLDFQAGHLSFLKESVEKLMRSTDVPNDMARPLLDAHDAVASSKQVEIDTDDAKVTP